MNEIVKNVMIDSFIKISQTLSILMMFLALIFDIKGKKKFIQLKIQKQLKKQAFRIILNIFKLRKCHHGQASKRTNKKENKRAFTFSVLLLIISKGTCKFFFIILLIPEA